MKKAMIAGLCVAAALVASAEMKVGTVNLETLIKPSEEHLILVRTIGVTH